MRPADRRASLLGRMGVPLATTSLDQRLGPFAPDRRAPGVLVRIGFALGVAAAALAVVRPVFEQTLSHSHLSSLRFPGIVIGVLAILVSLVAFFQVSNQGLRGRSLTLAGVSLGAIATLTVIIYTANADGNLRLGQFFHYYFNLHVMREIVPDLARGALNTLKAAFIAEVIAIAAGLILATFRLSPRAVVRSPAILYIDFVRAIPLVVVAFLVSFGLPTIGITLGTLAAVITTLVINASAYVAEIFRAGIQSLPRGQMDAARSLGMTHSAAMSSVIIPQAFRAVIPPLMNEFIALIKDTAIAFLVVGVTVGTRDMFTAAEQFAASSFSPTPFIGASIGYIIMIIPLSRLVGLVERRVRSGLV